MHVARSPDAPVRARLALAAAALVLAAAAPLPVVASEPVAVDTVVVTATRGARDPLDVPAAIDRVDAASARRTRGTLELPDALPRVPGVLVRDRQNEAQDLQVSVRGFGARSTFGVRGVRLYEDGIPATMPDGQGQVSHFVLDAAERLEVLRGPFSALYGNSSGGVIQLFSQAPPQQLELRAGPMVAGSDHVRGGLGVRGPWPGGGYAADGSASSTDGSRDHSQAERALGQLHGRGLLGAATRWNLTANVLDARADDPQGLTAEEAVLTPGAASPGALRFDTRKSTRQGQAGSRLEHAFGTRTTVSTGGYAGTRAIEQFLSVPVAAQANPLSGGGVVDLDRTYFGYDARLRHAAGAFALTLGAEREVSDEHRTGYENFVGETLGVRGVLRRDECGRVSAGALYGQAEWAPGTRWRLDAGVRWTEVGFRVHDSYVTAENPDDSGSRTDRRATPVAGVACRATSWCTVYANAGSGFETPTLSELAYRPDGTSGLNTDLRPARTASAEAGARVRRGAARLELCAFEARTEDEIAVETSAGGRTSYVNASESRRRGVELAGGYEPAGTWRGAFAYTFLDARFVRAFGAVAAGARIPGVPAHDGWAELGWTSGGWDVAFTARAVSQVFANDANTADAAGFARFDLGLARTFPVHGARVAAFVRADNLLDRNAIGSVIVNESNGRYFEPAPGRTWAAGFSLTSAPGGRP